MSLIWTEPSAKPQSSPRKSWLRCHDCGGRGRITVTWNGDEEECDACEGAGGFGPARKDA
jgi:DnaJ-class molecular chaperone